MSLPALSTHRPGGPEPLLPGARALIERVMRDGGPVAAECPLVFDGPLGPDRPGRLVALTEGERTLSACAIVPRDFVVGAHRLRLGLVGYVVTAPEARGRGYARAVLEAADRALADRGCVASLLWADDPAFYERLGYRAVGGELDFCLDPAALAALPRWRETRDLDPVADAKAVHALAAARPIRVERTLDETRALLAIPHLRARVALRDGAVVAYACEGRGADLGGVVHEWGGETLAVLGLAAELAAPHVDATGRAFLLAPFAALPVVQALVDLGLRPQPGVLGMARLLDPDAARPFVDGRGLDGAELLAALLPGPDAAGPTSPFGPLFAWGLDSI